MVWVLNCAGELVLSVFLPYVPVCVELVRQYLLFNKTAKNLGQVALLLRIKWLLGHLIVAPL